MGLTHWKGGFSLPIWREPMTALLREPRNAEQGKRSLERGEGGQGGAGSRDECGKGCHPDSRGPQIRCGVLGGDGDVARPGSNARGQGASPKYREESLDEDETVADLEERTAGKVGGNKHM